MEIEPERALMDPNHPVFTVGLILNGNRSVNFIKGPGDVGGPDVKFYTSIEKLVNALEDLLKHKVVNGFVVLAPPPAKGQAVPLFKIILHHENKLLPLLFIKHNLYFVGFKSKEGWYEYRPQPDKRKYIEGSKLLPFDCTYLQRTDKKKKNLSKICIDKNMLQVVFHNLREFRIIGKNMNVPYYRMHEFCDILCIFICEATRFKKVRRYITDVINDEQIKPFGQELEDIIKDWSSNSKDAKKSDLEATELEKLKAAIYVILY